MRDKRGYIPCKTHFPKRYVTAVSGGKKSAFIFKRSAVGAFGFGGVRFVAADFDMVKAAAVAVLAVVCAVVDVASDVSVYFHNKKPPYRFDFILHKTKGFIQEKRSNYQNRHIKIL